MEGGDGSDVSTRFEGCGGWFGRIPIGGKYPLELRNWPVGKGEATASLKPVLRGRVVGPRIWLSEVSSGALPAKLAEPDRLECLVAPGLYSST